MIRFLKRVLLFTAVLSLSCLFSFRPAFATTVTFQSVGNAGDEGVLTGSVTYDPQVVKNALENISTSGGMPGVLSLDELGPDSSFSFEFVSPHSGVKHTQDTICARNIYDMNNGLPGNEKLGGDEGPFFDFNGYYDLVSVDFRSCVGDLGDVDTKISDRDPRLSYSELESQYDQLKLIEADYNGVKPGRYRKRTTVEYKLEKV